MIRFIIHLFIALRADLTALFLSPMPPRWPRQPDRRDPDYRRLDDRMNFALHVAIYLAINSGLWFVHQIKPDTLLWLTWFSLGWLGLLALHGIFIFAIADYSPSSSPK